MPRSDDRENTVLLMVAGASIIYDWHYPGGCADVNHGVMLARGGQKYEVRLSSPGEHPWGHLRRVHSDGLCDVSLNYDTQPATDEGMTHVAEWKEIVRELERAVNQDAIPAIMLDLAERWEREAADRIEKALVDGMGARGRYDKYPAFHSAIHMVAQIAAFAVFQEPLVTDEERNARRANFELLGLAEPWNL